jgi:hypothetical protein
MITNLSPLEIKEGRVLTLDEIIDANMGELVTAQMLNLIPDEFLEVAQYSFAEFLNQGNVAMHQIAHQHLFPNLLRTKSPEIKQFTNPLDFFNYIYNPKDNQKFARYFAKNGTNADKKHYEGYAQLFPKNARPENEGFLIWLASKVTFLEVAHSPNVKTSPAHMVMVRRKDTQRIFEKAAERKIRSELRNLNVPVSLTDYAGIKIVGRSPQTTRKLVYGKKSETGKKPIYDPSGRIISFVDPEPSYRGVVYKGINLKLANLGFLPRMSREPSYDAHGNISGEQLPGIQNHYDNPNNNAHVIQLGLQKLGRDNQAIVDVEIAVTDFYNFLVDEMEHFVYRSKQEQARHGWSPKENARFKTYLERLMPIQDTLKAEKLIQYRRAISNKILPDNVRETVFTPGKFFSS